MGHSALTTADNSPVPLAASGAERLRFTDERFTWRFSPNQTGPELLEAIFADATTSDSTHRVLLYRPRGNGKSHFTSLLHHRLLTEEKLSESVHIAQLNEDETTTSMVRIDSSL